MVSTVLKQRAICIGLNKCWAVAYRWPSTGEDPKHKEEAPSSHTLALTRGFTSPGCPKRHRTKGDTRGLRPHHLDLDLDSAYKYKDHCYPKTHPSSQKGTKQNPITGGYDGSDGHLTWCKVAVVFRRPKAKVGPALRF